MGRLPKVEKKAKLWESFYKECFSLIIILSLSSFPTGEDTVRGGCEFSRYILISIILVSYTIDRYRNRFKKTTVA